MCDYDKIFYAYSIYRNSPILILLKKLLIINHALLINSIQPLVIILYQTSQATLVIWLPFVFAIQMLARPSFGFDFILFDIVATRKSIFIHSFTLTISQALVKMLSKYQRQRVFCRLFSTHTHTLTHTHLNVCVWVQIWWKSVVVVVVICRL